jgi:hypothetical protein
MDAFERERPTTQDACCAIAARVSVLADDGPWTDEHVIEALEYRRLKWVTRRL